MEIQLFTKKLAGKTIVASKETVKVNKGEAIVNQNQSGNANFIQDTKQELAKVVWPSRQQLLSESAAVMLMVMLVASIIYLVDQVFGWLAGEVIFK